MELSGQFLVRPIVTNCYCCGHTHGYMVTAVLRLVVALCVCMSCVCYYVWPFKGLTNYYRRIEKASGHKLSICGACYRPHLTTVYNTVVLCGASVVATGAIQSGRLYLS